MIKPIGKNIMLDINDNLSIGAVVDTEKRIEQIGTILAIGDEVDSKKFPIGGKLVFAGWAVYPTSIENKKYNFINCNSEGVLGMDE